MLALQAPGVLWVDVAAFEAAATAARQSQEPAIYHAAISLYVGDLLPEDRYADWAASQREALRQRFLTLLVGVAQQHAARGETALAIDALSRAVVHEPTYEEAHRELMRLYTRSEQRHRALQQYAYLRAALERELDAEPDPGSQRLYRDILAGDSPSTSLC